MVDFSKRLSVGVSFGLISEKELCTIITKYSDYIHDLFFSPTEGVQYLTRARIYNINDTSNDERRKMLFHVLDTAHKYGIKTSLTLNTPALNAQDALTIFHSYQSLQIIDYVTTTFKIATVIKEYHPDTKLVCSYNEAITNYNKLYRIVQSGVFNSIVLGNSFIRDKNAFNIIKEGGINTILLVNNGCTHGCTSYCRNRDENYCLNLFNAERLKHGVELLYSQQSVFPEELELYERNGFNIDYFKLSSRPISFNEYNALLSSYISLKSKPFITTNVYNYHLYARLAHFGNYYRSFNYERILENKVKLWKSLYGSSFGLNDWISATIDT